ncbi:M20 family metallo-hydrolase [Persicobacter diffluens]|uniref:Acetylornithine deacetylase n=1 Tax=Persicobacter diffluens TaxID=981 RepID=A0AAN4W191_9BACT|nr:acetylornithine deacetylase [Persicobacter diffluens]
MRSIGQWSDMAIDLLRKLIATPSLSREEDKTADLIFKFLSELDLAPKRDKNNVWAAAGNAPEGAPVLLLNSHHDTVKPNKGWTKDPFQPTIEEGVLYGLGSNDAGASAVSLLATFAYLSQLPTLPYQLIVAITAEEEVSGKDGIRDLLPTLGKIDCAIVGEPTEMQLAIAEKGLMVLDITAHGKAGHAAREEGENALYKAMDDIQWFRTHQFERVSDLLGPVKMSVTQINAGYQHNVVPDECSYVVDIRTNECYQNEEVLEIVKANIVGTINPRSYHLNSSQISLDHPLIQKGKSMGLDHYGSPTLSDQAMLSCPSLKMGPGKSSRSHTADEYILLSEIKEAIPLYIKLLENLSIPHTA